MDKNQKKQPAQRVELWTLALEGQRDIHYTTRAHMVL